MKTQANLDATLGPPALDEGRAADTLFFPCPVQDHIRRNSSAPRSVFACSSFEKTRTSGVSDQRSLSASGRHSGSVLGSDRENR
jgi:hypothetical protein